MPESPNHPADPASPRFDAEVPTVRESDARIRDDHPVAAAIRSVPFPATGADVVESCRAADLTHQQREWLEATLPGRDRFERAEDVLVALGRYGMPPPSR
jgi:hypothetical protein